MFACVASTPHTVRPTAHHPWRCTVLCVCSRQVSQLEALEGLSTIAMTLDDPRRTLSVVRTLRKCIEDKAVGQDALAQHCVV